jgi:hypothetical protein
MGRQASETISRSCSRSITDKKSCAASFIRPVPSAFNYKKANQNISPLAIFSGDHIGWLVQWLASIQSSKMQAIQQTRSQIQ